MATRAETLEKFFGRRAVSCFGIVLVLFILLVLAAVIFGKRNPKPPEGELRNEGKP